MEFSFKELKKNNFDKTKTAKPSLSKFLKLTNTRFLFVIQKWFIRYLKSTNFAGQTDIYFNLEKQRKKKRQTNQQQQQQQQQQKIKINKKETNKEIKSRYVVYRYAIRRFTNKPN